MTAFLLSVHVLAAILAIGPVAVAASMYAPAVRAAAESPDDARKAATVAVLHRITRVYSVIAIFVPVFGLATGARLGVLGDTWLIVSMILTAIAAAVLIGLILPGQRRLLIDLQDTATGRRLGMQTGIFNLLWAIVVVLMIYRPGSTTGAGL
ncbi:hypothetical protein GCM10029976_008130 [Kribbella albertanoniae]|uniref:DUF2269 family protein n=1 Tax=Kribbella albertanoniae TaxID=1266829 RepID=A0A4R4PWR4_9ACTN|nr:hypothetical protein [Kribbella albertanoniae]TDC26904.1 hypothetical protein E1261_21725 [Kribbella albertanoniae]